MSTLSHAGKPAAEVEMMRSRDREGDALPFPEHGPHDENIGNVHPALKGIVENESIPLLNLVAKLLE